MLDESTTLSSSEVPESQPPEEKGNRTFLIVGGIFAGLIFLTLVCMAVYFLLVAPRLANTSTSQEATAEAQRLEQAQAMTSTAAAVLFTPTVLNSPVPTNTRAVATVSAATMTPVVALPTLQNTATSDPGTMVAMQTQLSSQMTQTALGALATSSGAGQAPLPNTGFFDEVGLPFMAVLTLALLLVIFVARRMRKVPTQ